jgi:hypothetical protein
MARTLAVSLAALCSAIAVAQPIEVKLNNPGFSVTDLATTRRLFSDLGFLMSTGNPTRQAILFREGGGFEFAEHSDRSEGPRRADLEIVSADEAAGNLRATGLRTVGPTSGSRVISGETLKWFTLEFEDKLDSRPVYMVQILNREVLHGASFDHPNSASSLSAILVAVNDLEKAVAGYASIGKLNSREVAFPEFGAVAREIVLVRGSIFLLQATGPSSPTAQRIKTSGEGLFGMRLAVTDLGQARKAIGEKNISKDKRTVLVSPENAAGAWLEFHAK